MQDDERCCGTGTCIIDAAGRCWCGQQWNGERMCMPPLDSAPASAVTSASATTLNDAIQAPDAP
jgi:hypothetical protein